jgi:hypothetical protein
MKACAGSEISIDTILIESAAAYAKKTSQYPRDPASSKAFARPAICWHVARSRKSSTPGTSLHMR